MMMNRLAPDEYIIAAIDIYLVQLSPQIITLCLKPRQDIINLFLLILRLLGDKK